MDQQFSSLPLVASHIYGVRNFRIASYGALAAVTRDFEWFPGVNNATCDNGCERPAGISCTCGFYAFHGVFANSHRTPFHVEAVIAGEGRATVGDLGFRVEKAKIVALVDPYMQNSGRARFALLKRFFFPVITLLTPFVLVLSVLIGLIGQQRYVEAVNILWLSLVFIVIFSPHMAHLPKNVVRSFTIGRKLRLARNIYKDVAWYPSLEEAVKDYPLQGLPQDYQQQKNNLNYEKEVSE